MLAFPENQISLLAQLDSAFWKQQTDQERKCKRAMYAIMSHKLNHLLPFKTLMKNIMVNADFLWVYLITNVILFKEIVSKSYRPASKWFSVYFFGSTLCCKDPK